MLAATHVTLECSVTRRQVVQVYYMQRGQQRCVQVAVMSAAETGRNEAFLLAVAGGDLAVVDKLLANDDSDLLKCENEASCCIEKRRS